MDALINHCLKPIASTLPLEVTKANSKRAIYCRFIRAMHARRHAAVLACYTDFNNKLQSGRYMYFPRAVILAIYADFPAGT
jgi:hypothetical protein